MALHRRFRPVFKKYAPRGTARFAKPLQGPFSLVAKHPQKHKNRPEIGRFSHFNPGAEMHLFSLFSASKSPEKWLYDAICRKKQLFAGSFGSRSHSSCSFTTAKCTGLWKCICGKGPRRPSTIQTKENQHARASTQWQKAFSVLRAKRIFVQSLHCL